MESDVLDRDLCYRALRARDARFDGRIFVGVRTTGIYCRPICPARTPKLENVTFYASAAAAQDAGYRPCLRCRPESSPELAAWRGTSSTVSRAMLLIAQGALDGGESDVETFAQRLGLGGRQLRRLFQKHLGTSPIAVAQTRRLLFAKKLVHETSMPMAEIAHAAGFGSLRRFNDAFQRLYHRPPSELRRRHGKPESASDCSLTLSQSYVPPYDWPRMLRFYAARAVPGLEVVEGDRYARSIELGGALGTFAVSPSATKANSLTLTLRFPAVSALPVVVSRVRSMFDLDADVRAIFALLSRDPLLAPLVAARPGLRVPGAWDPFELGVRAILGQQITVGAARGLAGKLVAAYGPELAPSAASEAVTRVFPRPATLANAELAPLGMPRARAATLSAFARLVLADPELFAPTRSLEATLSTLRSVPGIGDWTAEYIALRALRDPDAFPATDLGLLRGATENGVRPTPVVLAARAEAWRPWRGYAAQHLWCADPGEPIAKERAARQSYARATNSAMRSTSLGAAGTS